MPEGPSLVIAKETITPFAEQKISRASGTAGAFIKQLVGESLQELHTWGKLLLIVTENHVVRIHFLMFGSYSIGERTKPKARIKLQLDTAAGSLFFYTCSVKLFPPEHLLSFDWTADVMDASWDPAKAKQKLRMEPGALVCDALLDQQIFSGVGNIIKNEVLFRIRVHPETMIKHLPQSALNRLLAEARKYSFDFLNWKKAGVLKKHWLVHTKKICANCEGALTKKYCGISKRRTFFCGHCQVLYKQKNIKNE